MWYLYSQKGDHEFVLSLSTALEARSSTAIHFIWASSFSTVTIYCLCMCFMVNVSRSLFILTSQPGSGSIARALSSYKYLAMSQKLYGCSFVHLNCFRFMKYIMKNVCVYEVWRMFEAPFLIVFTDLIWKFEAICKLNKNNLHCRKHTNISRSPYAQRNIFLMACLVNRGI